MGFSETILASLRALTANRMRSTLTVLGVIIGVASVITLVSIGQGAEMQVSGELASLGTNLITVIPGKGIVLTAQDVDYALANVSLLGTATPLVQVSSEVSYESLSKTASIHGASPEYKEIRARKVEKGRFITPFDVSSRTRVLVLGQTIVDDLFQGKDPIGKTMSIKGQSFKVVGILEKVGQSFGVDNDNLIIVPYTTLQRIAGTDRISAIYAQSKDANQSQSTVKEIESKFNLKFRRENSVTVASQEQLLSLVATITGTFTVLLASIAGVSLLVGGIGIMNIMLVSVTERTREIGLRKAIGAKNSHILMQFLVEAAILGSFGGAIGIALGVFGSRVIANLGNLPGYTSPQAIAMGFGVSLAIGLFFGLFPAARAAKMDPISCLRYE